MKKQPIASKHRSRSPNLSDSDIEQIVKIIDEWSGPKLTWELLLGAVQKRLHARYVRQTLDKYARISDAFTARKRELAGRDPIEKRPLSPEQKRIANLEAQVNRLKRENHNLLEQFNRWVFNGHRMQMDNRMREAMNEPLPPVHRGASKISKS